MSKLVSYKVYSSKDGTQVFTVVAAKYWTLKELNKLFRNGMNVTVVDQRSEMVNKEFVDNPDKD